METKQFEHVKCKALTVKTDDSDSEIRLSFVNGEPQIQLEYTSKIIAVSFVNGIPLITMMGNKNGDNYLPIQISVADTGGSVIVRNGSNRIAQLCVDEDGRGQIRDGAKDGL